jgi:hypothetical protein
MAMCTDRMGTITEFSDDCRVWSAGQAARAIDLFINKNKYLRITAGDLAQPVNQLQRCTG